MVAHTGFYNPQGFQRIPRVRGIHQLFEGVPFLGGFAEELAAMIAPCPIHEMSAGFPLSPFKHGDSHNGRVSVDPHHHPSSGKDIVGFPQTPTEVDMGGVVRDWCLTGSVREISGVPLDFGVVVFAPFDHEGVSIYGDHFGKIYAQPLENPEVSAFPGQNECALEGDLHGLTDGADGGPRTEAH